MREGAAEARASTKFRVREVKEALPKAAPFVLHDRIRYCTVKVVEAVTPLNVPVIVVVPVEMPVAKPAVLMVAAAVLLEVHVAELVTS